MRIEDKTESKVVEVEKTQYIIQNCMSVRNKNIYYKTIRPAAKNIYYSFCAGLLRIVAFLLFWIRPKAITAEQIDKILLIKLERIGDLVLSTPAIRAIKEKFPHADIALIVNSYTQAVIENNPYVDEIIVYGRAEGHKSLIKRIDFIKQLRSKKFDLGIDLTTRDFFFLPAWLLCFSRAKITLGLDNFGRGFLFNLKVRPDKRPKPLTKEVLHILDPLEISGLDNKPRVFLSENNKNYINELLDEQGIGENDILVCIHPGGVFETKYWTKDGYAKVAEYLFKQYQAKVFFIGSKQEAVRADEIIARIEKKPVNLTGKISLGQVSALIAKCRLFIGNNSGPLHIAAALGIPTISFLGPSVPERWSPNEEKDIVFKIDLDCRPCELGYCYRKDLACMNSILPEEVIAAVDRQLRLLQ
ncbi:MAG: glycosyltransferase family 9 protein [Candidatus Omnitrophota bacterium]